MSVSKLYCHVFGDVWLYMGMDWILDLLTTCTHYSELHVLTALTLHNSQISITPAKPFFHPVVP
jgi:hypothetical protein